MIGSVPAALGLPVSLRWRRIAVVALVLGLMVPNVLLLRESLGTLRAGDWFVYDWWLIEQAATRAGTGTMYEWGAEAAGGAGTYLYRYSPLLPHVMAPIVDYGLQVWRLLHVAVLILLPRPVAGLALLAGPFWFDVVHGNFLTFAVVLAWLALDGRRWAQVGYFALTMLIPRPLMMPVVVWLLWRRPESRPIFAAVLVANIVGLAWTGEALAWMGALLASGGTITSFYDVGPSRIIGPWWLPIGLALGAWLTWKGRLGLASLAVSPYVWPYYLVMALLELRRGGAEVIRDDQ